MAVVRPGYEWLYVAGWHGAGWHGAGWHGAEALEPPEGLTPLPLPPYSPELQPAERLWPLTDEPLANRAFGSLAEIERVLEDRCVRLGDRPEVIRAHTLFHWWPRPRKR